MANEDKNIGGSLVLDLRIWWRHVKTLYTGTPSTHGPKKKKSKINVHARS